MFPPKVQAEMRRNSSHFLQKFKPAKASREHQRGDETKIIDEVKDHRRRDAARAHRASRARITPRTKCGRELEYVHLK